MAKRKNKSLLQRLRSASGRECEDTPAQAIEKPRYICQTSEDDPEHYYRWRMVNGNLEPIDGFPYDSYDSCMGIVKADDEG